MKKKKNGVLFLFEIGAAIALVIMVFLVFTNAFLRYFMNSSIIEAEELSRYMFVWTVFIGTIIAFKDKAHIGVNIVVDLLKGTPKLILTIISDILVIFALVIVFYGSIKYTNTAFTSIGPATGIRFSYISISLVVASGFMIVIASRSLFLKVKQLRGKEV